MTRPDPAAEGGGPEHGAAAPAGVPAADRRAPGESGTAGGPGAAAGARAADAGAVALVESPVQLLNVLEWALGQGDILLHVVVLPPREAGARGQLRRMARLAQEAGHRVVWREVRSGGSGIRSLPGLAARLRGARLLLIGDPFSRWIQLLLALSDPREVVVVDDGTATMEFAGQLARGERLVRWHRRPSRGPGATVFAPVARRAVTRLLPQPGRRRVEVFSAMPVEVPDGIQVIPNDFPWTRDHFGPPAVLPGADLVGTSLVETGVVREDDYLAAVTALTKRYGITRYFAHRRERAAKLRRVALESGLEIIRPDLPLELVARRGPVAAHVLSFPSTVVHTLPQVLADTPVKVSVCEVDDDWLTERASPRARVFLASVTRTASGVHGLATLSALP
ncbi:hypothetical protein [Streptomyces aidingensis]|uniref:Uncharacterized protein n=1 Tax=Streptomyces aidingensis TaxID=910347 RepID=A0A1I1EH97_9ACTN|nr:hypothetical protein [Streptomyces aidingensis]SFB86387.1 hypothetical protein SAMN05421773_101302 [Streptomyces aidingensis]